MSAEKKTVKSTAKDAGVANKKKDTLVKVIVLDDKGHWVSPEKGSVHYINEDAIFPEITFEIETTSQGPYEWSWIVQWDSKVSGLRDSSKSKRGALLKKFQEKGGFSSFEKKWKVNFNGKILGGTLTVSVKFLNEEFKRSIFIKGKNPTEEKIKSFSDSLDGTQGFHKILMHEALGKNFINADGEPVVSFDKGYGITQITNPAPNFEQCWSWKENIKIGAGVYKQKRKEAISFFSRSHAAEYTEEMVQKETYSRYNGGGYYIFDEKSKKFLEKPFICDPNVANVGWDTNKTENKGKSAEELHERDLSSKEKKAESKLWQYTGVCYARHISDK